MLFFILYLNIKVQADQFNICVSSFCPLTITNYHKFCDKDEERSILVQFWMSQVYDGCLELKVRTVFLLVGLGDNVFSHTENLLKMALYFLVSCPFPIFQASGTQKSLSHTVTLHL